MRLQAQSLAGQVYERLLADIEGGVYPVDSKIPSERELQQQYGVSRSTIREAVSQLVAAGLLRRHQGLGTFVQAPRIIEPIGAITSFAEQVRARGMAHEASILSCTEVVPPRHIQMRLKLGTEQATTCLVRLRRADGVVVMLSKDYVPVSAAPDLCQGTLVDDSLYRGLEEHYGIHLQSAEEEVEAIIPSRKEARLLEMPSGAPVLFLRRVTFGSLPVDRSQSSPVHYVETAYRADRFRYVAHLLDRDSEVLAGLEGGGL
jgi:GntR family transcriptional regulator